MDLLILLFTIYIYPKIWITYWIFRFLEFSKCRRLDCIRHSCTESLDVDTSISYVKRLSVGRAPFVKTRLEQALTSMYGDKVTERFPPLEQYQNSLITINVFFTTISQTIMEKEEKISVFDLISNVGGQLGSIITGYKSSCILWYNHLKWPHSRYFVHWSMEHQSDPRSQDHVATKLEMCHLAVIHITSIPKLLWSRQRCSSAD